MKKFCLAFILVLILSSSLSYAQTTEGKRKPSDPTPERETRTGLVSIVGLMGPVSLKGYDYSTENPSLKIGFQWNINPYLSISLGGGIIKYSGPTSFLIEKEGYYLSPTFLSQLENYYFGASKIEESWYAAQLTLRLTDSTISPYIFGGLKYLSIDYEQEMFFNYIGETVLYNDVWQVTLNEICGYGGAGIGVSVMDYLEVLFEFEYDYVFNSDIVPDKMLFSAGFRFTI